MRLMTAVAAAATASTAAATSCLGSKQLKSAQEGSISQEIIQNGPKMGVAVVICFMTKAFWLVWAEN